ncbi:hypothetical protein AJ87_26965 [Rhizobium yanglingense]|nr:hypothetical protein AJ87_26965 [Rhizobium yanglingense]
MQFTRLACEEVILSDRNQVTLDDFAKVYVMLSAERDPAFNMFFSAAWKNIQLPEGMINGKAYEKVAKRKLKTYQVA